MHNIHAPYALAYAATRAFFILLLNKKLNIGDEIFRKDDIWNIKEWLETVIFKSVLKKLRRND
jgi:hypothetical protein